MATYTKHILTGSANGRGILVAASATPGTNVHDATNDVDTLDEVWLWGINHGSSQVDLTLEWGDVTSGDRIEVGLPSQAGLVALVPGLVISGGVSVAAYASAASGCSIFGFVNRIAG